MAVSMNGWSILAICACVAGLNLLTAWMARRGAAAFPPTGEHVDVGGVRLHLVRMGTGSPLALLHGSDGSLQDFTESIVPLLAEDFDCVAIDRPGHGHSGVIHGVAPTLDVQSELVYGCLQALGIERPILVGHSWGAAMALAISQNHPHEIAGLVLVSGYVYPGAKITSRFPRLPLWTITAIPRVPLIGGLVVSTVTPLVKNVMLRIGLALAFSPDPVPPRYYKIASALWLRSAARVRVVADENATDEPIVARLSRAYGSLEMPIYLICGAEDRILPPSLHSVRFHEETPQSTLEVIPGAGHQLLQTHSREVVSTIRQAAREVEYRYRANANSNRCELTEDRGLRRARSLVYSFGWNATAYQILNSGMSHWFSPTVEAVVGYVTRYGVRVAAGAPVSAEDNLATAVREFEAEAKASGERVCWFGAAERMRAILHSGDPADPHAQIVIGAQPVWAPSGWPEVIRKNSSLRGQLNRARNKGVTVCEWDRDDAAKSADLSRIIDEWLATRALPRLGFLTEPVSPARLVDRRIFVAEMGGRPVAFGICAPVPLRSGWLVEQIARERGAPNGTPEQIVNAVMNAVGAEGGEFVSLGLAPLSRRAAPAEPGRAALVVRLLLRWIRAHGRRFYNFEGLDAFKAKLRPDYWEPLYAISNERTVSPSTLYSIAAAFSDSPPPIFLSRAVFAAAKQELKWLHNRGTDGVARVRHE